MTVELLRALSDRSLPLTITDPIEIEKIFNLVAAGALVATLSPSGSDAPFAHVLSITKLGRAAVAFDARKRSKPA